MNHKYSADNNKDNTNEGPDNKVAPCDNCGMRMTEEDFPEECPGRPRSPGSWMWQGGAGGGGRTGPLKDTRILRGFLNAIMPKHRKIDVSNIKLIEGGLPLKDIWDRFDKELPDARGIFEGGDPYGSRRAAIHEFFHGEIFNLLRGLKEEIEETTSRGLVADGARSKEIIKEIDKLINSL